MTEAEQLANKMNGCQYRRIDEFEHYAKEHDLVIVTGASDDLVEFEGAIYDEVGAYDGTTIYILNGEILHECNEPCDHCQIDSLKTDAKRVVAKWATDEYSWELEAQGFTAYSFDMFEDDEKFCKGLVFDVREVQ